jgi:hypothetical protein
MENITNASVISRANAAESPRVKKRLAGISKCHLVSP